MELALKARAGDKRAMSTLLVAHDGFIINTARRFVPMAEDPEGAMQVARMGFMRAIKTWSVRRGALNLRVRLDPPGGHPLHGRLRGDIRVPIHAGAATRKVVRLGATTAEEAVKLTGRSAAGVAWDLRYRARRLDAPMNDDADADSLIDVCPGDMPTPEEVSTTLDRRAFSVAMIERAMLGLSRSSKRSFGDDTSATTVRLRPWTRWVRSLAYARSASAKSRLERWSDCASASPCLSVATNETACGPTHDRRPPLPSHRCRRNRHVRGRAPGRRLPARVLSARRRQDRDRRTIPEHARRGPRPASCRGAHRREIVCQNYDHLIGCGVPRHLIGILLTGDAGHEQNDPSCPGAVPTRPPRSRSARSG